MSRVRVRGISAFVLFVGVQIGDALCTRAGVIHFGWRAEANPLLLALMAAYGVTTALVGAKMVAIAGGMLLYAQSRYVTLALLTVAYVYGALLPWMWVLS